MNKIILILGVGLVGGVVMNFDNIKNNYYKYDAITKSNKLIINFFRDEIKENNNITLKEAILKFEDPHKEFKTLEELSDRKGRNIDCYINAYSNLFDKAKN